MIIKVDDTLCPIRQNPHSKLYYADIDGVASSGKTESEVIENLKSRYKSVIVVSEK